MTTQTGVFPPATVPSSWIAAPGPTTPPPPSLPPLDPRTGLPTGAHYRDLAYHRLALSDPKHRRWSPLAEGGALVAGIMLVTIVFAIGVAIVALILGADSFFMDMSSTDVEQMDMTNPWIFLFLFGSVAIWMPVVLLMRWLLRPRPLGLIWSVTGRIRWKWLLTTMGLATAVFVLIYGLMTVLEVALAGAGGGEATATVQRHPLWWLTLIMGFLVVPIQCTAEELVFRGYLAQAIGRWLKNPAWAILLPAPVFMLGHMYDVWGQLSVLWMAVVAGFITWRTGGLEAAISLHVVNNMVVTVTSVLWPSDPTQASESSVGFMGFGVIFVIELVYGLLVLLLSRGGRVARSRHAIVWPKKDQDAWYDRVRAAYAPVGYPYAPGHYAPAPHHQAPGAYQSAGGFGPGQPPQPAQFAQHHQPVAQPPLVPVTIPASMAYVDPGQVGENQSLRLVPAEGLIAYAAPELEPVPGTNPPVFAHRVVWMARPLSPQADGTPAPWQEGQSQ